MLSTFKESVFLYSPAFSNISAQFMFRSENMSLIPFMASNGKQNIGYLSG